MNIKYNIIIFPQQNYSELLNYQFLTISTARNHLKQKNNYIGIEACFEEQKIGFIFAQLFKNQTAQIFSLFVEEPFRKQKIGQTLFEHLIDLLVKEKKMVAVGFEYEDLFPESLIIEKILARQKNWHVTQPYLIRYYFDSYQFDPSWIYLPFRPLETIEFFKWSDLTDKDHSILQEMKQNNEIPSLLWPFRGEEKIEYRTSVGLRYKSQLVGWCVTHRLENTLRYSILYVQKNLQRFGYGIQLLIESIKLHDQLMHGEDPIPLALFEVRPEQINSTWARFIEKRLLPYAIKVSKKKWVVKFYNENILI
ncbi:GNAT family N-acetyltransferase [Candidatus Protochlamydia sp. R18]|uniref:GNAT family N-acetyltransferase n=1 Tax=Candidatus Protochlamydia sp. R18 TaxID=1353977 RepID=UPI0005AB46AB|nr:GNAT family N-acetyltransferase [Candidatus Protochlamydia sp. R18]